MRTPHLLGFGVPMCWLFWVRNKRLAFCPQDASAHSQLVGHTTPLRQQATLTLTTKAKLQIERVPLKQQHYNATASPLGYEYCRVRRDII